MSIDKVPIVTTLLRASRSQDEDTLRQVFESILKNGVSEIELNADDCSGRVSVHNSIASQKHICLFVFIFTLFIKVRIKVCRAYVMYMLNIAIGANSSV